MCNVHSQNRKRRNRLRSMRSITTSCIGYGIGWNSLFYVSIVSRVFTIMSPIFPPQAQSILHSLDSNLHIVQKLRLPRSLISFAVDWIWLTHSINVSIISLDRFLSFSIKFPTLVPPFLEFLSTREHAVRKFPLYIKRTLRGPYLNMCYVRSTSVGPFFVSLPEDLYLVVEVQRWGRVICSDDAVCMLDAFIVDVFC